MKAVSHILGTRKGNIISVKPTDSVRQALEVMAKAEVGAVLVMEQGKLVGILSERDYARKIVLKGKGSEATQVSEIMSERVICVSLRTTTEEAMAIMSERSIRHLPVVDEANKVLGVISIRDLVREIISEQSFVIEQLEKYITT